MIAGQEEEQSASASECRSHARTGSSSVLEPLSQMMRPRRQEPAPRCDVLKIIIVGDSGVGKTCLTHRFCNKSFMGNSDTTIGVDFHEKTVQIGDDAVKLQLWDTAGQERFRKSMIRHYYRNAHAVVIVYDVTKISTFNSVENWLKECSEHGLGGTVPRVLVGTKCDRTEEKVIGTFAAQRIADYHGMPLFETSALSETEIDTVESIFVTLAYKLYNRLPFRIVSIDENGPTDPETPSTRVNTIVLSERNSLHKKKCC